MLAEWSVECAPDDPVLVVPWDSDAEGGSDFNDALHASASSPGLAFPDSASLAGPHTPRLRFVDLRENPYDLDHLPEAEQYPPLMHALRALNATRSPVFTAKCDAWILGPEELKQLQTNLDLDRSPYGAASDLEAPAAHGFGSYIDLLLRERSLFISFHQNEQLLHRLVRRAEPLDHPHAMLDCVIRPALVDLTGPQEGFAITLYIKALGPDPKAAFEHWSAALDAAVSLLRSKDLF